MFKCQKNYVHNQFLAQSALLQHFCKSKVEQGRIRIPQGTINYVMIERDKNKVNPSTIVLTHGYGSGLGFFYPNLDALSQVYDRVIAVDWLGMGGSSRLPNTSAVKMKPICSNGMTPTKATEFFIDSFESFRKAMGVKRFVLAGHSLGGYLSAQYALKYHEDLAGLVLISPVGVPKLPEPDRIMQSHELSWGMRLLDGAWRYNFTPQVPRHCFPSSSFTRHIS